MIITDEVRCWFDAVLWGRLLLKFGIGRKLFRGWTQKTKLICTIDNCGVFFFIFLFCSFTCWRLNGSAHLFHLLFIHVLCHGHFFSDFFFTIPLFLFSLILCTQNTKMEGQENRVDRRWGVWTRTRSGSRAGRLPQSPRTGREPSQRGWMKLCWTGIKVERRQWRKKLADEEGMSEVKSKKGLWLEQGGLATEQSQ